jgi:hypothetical protein
VKYSITVCVEDGPKGGTILTDCWDVDTGGDGWRDDLPDRDFFVELIEDYEGSDEALVRRARKRAELRDRLGLGAAALEALYFELRTAFREQG